ncbi:hypothetical protein FEM48_Zijuj04G0013800 [Ziziphus jujuba var. spinosa]|uniref:Amino acid transporter transmembrane domain-containing protein n=1 Tax=Ziziphus jujuba var. spinosa TaxID=714518 RepID=A0A978VH13_ZIZJJ|nr:hypothetical protein FEM48_Zijuj04G0013800 [Ziziphus jujuba var. spinosa]
MIFASVHFVLSHLPNFNSISSVSLAAAVMSLSYSTIAWGASIDKGAQSDVECGYKSKTAAGTVFNFFGALDEVAFAYAGHNVVEDNILISLEKPAWLIAMANMFVVIHVIGSYQIYAMPVFGMIETILVKKLHFTPSTKLRFIVRNIYVGNTTMLVGIAFPFFSDLLSFFGGFDFAPTTYYLPCIMWHAIKKPRKYSLSWWINWVYLHCTWCTFDGSTTYWRVEKIIFTAMEYEFYS